MQYIFIKASLCAILFYIIFDDIRNYKIRNQAILALVGLFFLQTVMEGDYRAAGIQLLIALFLFLILLVPYSLGLFGGGDVKLLGAALLWLGDSERMIFAFLFLLLTLIYMLAAKSGLAPSRGKTMVFMPFAPSIAGAWLLTLAVTTLQP